MFAQIHRLWFRDQVGMRRNSQRYGTRDGEFVAPKDVQLQWIQTASTCFQLQTIHLSKFYETNKHLILAISWWSPVNQKHGCHTLIRCTWWGRMTSKPLLQSQGPQFLLLVIKASEHVGSAQIYTSSLKSSTKTSRSSSTKTYRTWINHNKS